MDKVDHFYIKVLVQKSDYFVRDGFDIRTKADIDVHTALHGGEIKVKGLHEPYVTVRIPGGTSSHQTVTLPGNGIRREGLYGNQVVEIGIDTMDVDERDKPFLEEMKSEKNNPVNVITPLVHSRSF